jgi:hypothetical protein
MCTVSAKNMNDFEKWFDRRNRILAFRYDAIESTIEITIVEDPDHLRPQATFVVKGVKKLNVDRFHDPDEACMGDCEKYELKKEAETYIHEIRTGDAIVTFETIGVFEEKR